MTIYTPNSIPFEELPSKATPIRAAWLNQLDLLLSAESTAYAAAGEQAGITKRLRLIHSVAGSLALHEAILGEVIFAATAAPGAGAHAIALMGRAIREAGSVTAPLLLGVEGVLQNAGAGEITLGGCVVAHCNQNLGNIVLGFGHGSFISNNQGTIQGYAHFYVDAGGNEINDAIAEWALYNPKARALVATRGRIFGPLGWQLGFTGAEVAPPKHAGMAPGVRYSCGSVASADVALTADLAMATPVYVPHRVTLASFGCTVVTAGAAGTKARIGLYPFVAGALGPKMAECAEFAVDSTGDKTGAVAGSVVIEAGMYALLINSSGAPVIQWNVDYTLSEKLGTTNSTRNDTLLYVVSTYGALPNTPTMTRTANAGSLAPHCWLQVA